MELPTLLDAPGEDVGWALTGIALLLVPYVLYGIAGRGLRPAAWVSLLALLVVSTVLGLLAAGSSSTGALIFLWLLPAQCVVSWLATLLTPGAVRKQ